MKTRPSTSFVDCYVGQRIAEERHGQRITQQELANRSGITREIIAQIETGGQNITLLSLVKLAAALGVDPGSWLPSTALLPEGES